MIEARHQLGALGQRNERGRVGAEIAEVRGPQRQEGTVRIERELGLHAEVPGLVVAQEGFLALADPFDRPSEAARRPGHERKFGIT